MRWMKWSWMTPEQFRAQQPALVIAALTVLILLEMGRFVATARADGAAPSPAGAAMSAAAPSRVTKPVNVAAIVAAHLFGVAAPPPGTGDAPDAGASFSLTGIYATPDPNYGYVILGPANVGTSVYRAGAELSGPRKGRVFQVFRDRVLLVFDGQYETLRLPHLGGAGNGRLAKADAAPATAAGAGEAVAAVAVDPGPGAPSAAKSWFAGLDADSHRVAGVADGLVLHPETRMQRLYKLHEGDIVMSVNGQPTTDAESLDAALRNAGNSLSLTLMRDGTMQTRTVSLNN